MRGFNGLAAHGDGPRELARPVRLPVDQVGASPRVETGWVGWDAGSIFGRFPRLVREFPGSRKIWIGVCVGGLVWVMDGWRPQHGAGLGGVLGWALGVRPDADPWTQRP